MPECEVPLAVIPAAGLGTRMAPATWVLPKELMPVGPQPLIQWALEEVALAGVPRAAVIVSPAKPLLTKFLSQWRLGREIELTVVSQPRAVGLADALLRIESLTRGRPIALLLPDNVFFPYAGAPPALTQVIEAFTASHRDTTGVIRVHSKDAHAFGHAGLVDLYRRKEATAGIRVLHPKREGTLRLKSGFSAYKTFARTVLLPHFFEYLRDSMKRGRPTDEVPALQTIVKRHGFSAVLLKGRGFDAGNPAGFAAAVTYWARRESRRSTKS